MLIKTTRGPFIVAFTAPAEVKDTWQLFKDRYTTERKVLNKQPPSGSQATPPTTPSWFYKQIEFLDKHIKQRQYSMMLNFCLKNLIIGINVINTFIRRQSNCEDTSDVSTDERASVVRKEMPHEVIEINIKDIETAPKGFQPDEKQTFSISEEYAQNSAAPDDEG